MPYFKDKTGALHFLSDQDVANGGVSLLPKGAKSIADDAAGVPSDLDIARTAQGLALSQACRVAIVGGFTCNARSYPSALTDQSNQTAVANSSTGGALWCATAAGAWALVEHNQSDAQAVLAAFVTHLNACQAQLAGLLAQVAMAQTVEAVAAVVWSDVA